MIDGFIWGHAAQGRNTNSRMFPAIVSISALVLVLIAMLIHPSLMLVLTTLTIICNLPFIIIIELLDIYWHLLQLSSPYCNYCILALSCSLMSSSAHRIRVHFTQKTPNLSYIIHFPYETKLWRSSFLFGSPPEWESLSYILQSQHASTQLMFWNGALVLRKYLPFFPYLLMALHRRTLASWNLRW